MVVLVRPESPAKDIPGLIALIQKSPKFDYGSSGNGSILHLTAELFRLRTGVKMQHIPYRGSAPAQQALLAGEIDVVFDALAPAMGQIQAGKLRAVGLAMAKRSPALPDLKTDRRAGRRRSRGLYLGRPLCAPRYAGADRAAPECRAAEGAEGSRGRQEDLRPWLRDRLVDPGRAGGPHGGRAEEVDGGRQSSRREARLGGGPLRRCRAA